jgi:hypothetical protein
VNGNAIEKLLDIAKEITEELGTQVNLEQLLNIDKIGLQTNNESRRIYCSKGKDAKNV